MANSRHKDNAESSGAAMSGAASSGDTIAKAAKIDHQVYKNTVI